MGPEREVAHALPAYPAHAGREPRMDRAAWRSVPRRSGAVMDAVQRLRRRAQSAGRLVTTPQEIVRTEQEPTRIEKLITIEARVRGRLRADLRSFIRLRSLALPRLSAVFCRSSRARLSAGAVGSPVRSSCRSY